MQQMSVLLKLVASQEVYMWVETRQSHQAHLVEDCYGHKGAFSCVLEMRWVNDRSVY